MAGSVLLCIGVVAGRAARPRVPPLIIERSANSPLNSSPAGSGEDRDNAPAAAPDKLKTGSNSQLSSAEEVVYVCGARTRKGTPCSRRVHGPVRCWQHKGMPAMLPAEKLVIRE